MADWIKKAQNYLSKSGGSGNMQANINKAVASGNLSGSDPLPGAQPNDDSKSDDSMDAINRRVSQTRR